MRRVSWKALASLSVVVIVALVILSGAAIAQLPSAHGLQATARAPGQSSMAPATHPLAGPTVTPTITNLPLPAAVTDPFSVRFSVTYTGVPAGLAVNNTTATFTLVVYNGTTPGNVSIDPTTVVYAQTAGAAFSAFGSVLVNAQVLTSSGYDLALTPLNALSFKVSSSAFVGTPENGTGTSAQSGTVAITPVTASITSLTAPAATATVPFAVAYTVTASGANVTSATTSALVSVFNSTGGSVATSYPVTGEVVTGTGQNFTVDYPMLTSLNYKAGNIPSGTYNLSLSFVASNGFGITSAGSVMNATVTMSTFNVVVLPTVAMAVYQSFPFTVTWNVTGGGSSFVPGSTDVTQNLTVFDITSANVLVPVVTIAVPYNSTGNSWTLTIPQILSGNYTGSKTNPLSLPPDPYQISIQAVASPVGAGQRAAFATMHGFIITVPPVVDALNASQINYGGVTGGIGNVTIVSIYNGTFVSKAFVTVATSTGAVALNASVLSGAGGQQTVTTSWVPTAAGNYTITLTVINNAGVVATKATPISVIATGGGVITKNNYHNATLIPGLSSGASAAILLVVGVVVGLLVGLFLARAMWARPKTEPAQAWQAQTGTHECPVCHQTFSTEAELSAHSASAHGITTETPKP